MFKNEFVTELLAAIANAEREIQKLKDVIYKLNERIAYVTNPDSELMMCKEDGFKDQLEGVQIGDARWTTIMRDGK